MHSLFGFHSQEDQENAWITIPGFTFQQALQALSRFEQLYGEHFLASKWKTTIHKRLGIGPSSAEHFSHPAQALEHYTSA